MLSGWEIMEILTRHSVEHLAPVTPFPSVLSFRFRHFEQPRAFHNPFSPAIPSTIATVMCGRFAFFAKGRFGYGSLQPPEPPPIERYNIAPDPGHPRHSYFSQDWVARPTSGSWSCSASSMAGPSCEMRTATPWSTSGPMAITKAG